MPAISRKTSLFWNEVIFLRLRLFSSRRVVRGLLLGKCSFIGSCWSTVICQLGLYSIERRPRRRPATRCVKIRGVRSNCVVNHWQDISYFLHAGCPPRAHLLTTCCFFHVRCSPRVWICTLRWCPPTPLCLFRSDAGCPPLVPI